MTPARIDMDGLTAVVQHASAPAGRRQHKIAHPKTGKLDAPVLVHDDDGIWVVRLLRECHEGDGNYMGRPLAHLREIYLDGRQHKRTYGDGRITKSEEEELEPMATISAARTKDTIDYGRFTQACTALVRAVDAAGPDASDEQTESILKSYQGLLAWREDLTQKILQIDGALDVAAAKVRQALQ